MWDMYSCTCTRAMRLHSRRETNTMRTHACTHIGTCAKKKYSDSLLPHERQHAHAHAREREEEERERELGGGRERVYQERDTSIMSQRGHSRRQTRVLPRVLPTENKFFREHNPWQTSVLPRVVPTLLCTLPPTLDREAARPFFLSTVGTTASQEVVT